MASAAMQAYFLNKNFLRRTANIKNPISVWKFDPSYK